MRCSICGAKLKKDGDICSNCYKEYQEDEELKKDVNEQYKVKRKYSILYEFLRYLDIILIFVLCFVICVITKSFGEAALVALFLIIFLAFILFWDKRIANATKIVFYEKKVEYRFKFLFINKRKIVKYKDIRDVNYYQTFRQKRLGLGDICFYAVGDIPGTNLLNAFQIKDVENVKETLEEIRKIVGTLE